MKTQLSLKTLITYFVSQNQGVKAEQIVETLKEYNPTNALGSVHVLIRQGVLRTNANKFDRTAPIFLDKKGEERISKKLQSLNYND